MRMSNTNKALMVIVLPISVFVGMWIGRELPGLAFVFLLALAAFVAWILLSNKQGTQVTGAARDAALSMTPPNGMARLYVSRVGFAGGMQGMNVALSSGHEGQIRAKYVMMAELAPGTYQLSARMAKQGEKQRRSTDVTLAAGDNVLIEVTLEMGIIGMSPIFEEVRDAVAIRSKLMPIKMVDWLSAGR